MKIMILNGSPRPKGNTKQMIQAFCEGLETAGHEYGVYDVCKIWGFLQQTAMIPAFRKRSWRRYVLLAHR